MKPFLSQVLDSVRTRLTAWRAIRAFKKDMRERRKLSIAAFRAWWNQAPPTDKSDRSLQIQPFCMYLPKRMLDRFTKEVQRRRQLAR